MRADDFSYHILEYPFPDDFVAWYPYTKSERMGEHDRWRQWLVRVVEEGVPGVRDQMIAARDVESGDWVGVVWNSVAPTCPEIAHFGWFYVEDRCRGAGVGGRVIETCLSNLSADGAKAVMLPTQLENERAIGMYYRRGWHLSITDPNGGVWMVREPADYYEYYFTPEGREPIRAGEPEPADFVALDYLLSRPYAPVRLLPLELVGNRRFVSFVHDWDSATHVVARQEDRPLAVGAAVETEEGSLCDVFGVDRRAMAVAMRALVEIVPRPYADIAAHDTMRRGALEDAGMRYLSAQVVELARAQINMARYIPV